MSELPSTEFTLEDLREIAYRGSYDDMQRSLARALLAAYEQEPVGEVIEQPAGLVMDGLVNLEASTYRNIKGIARMKRMPLGTKFYATPAPSISATVPDEMTKRLFRLREHALLAGSYDVTGEWEDLVCDALRALDACRAAMIKAGNSPVIPEEVTAAILEIVRVRNDLHAFDGDKRGIAECLCEKEEALICIINERHDEFRLPEGGV
ncbi:hypothetical protein HV265_12870 [Citrobacter sp. RHBSTW-00678]|uniref:hypothetical protein n=1 Tax=Citrobacter sp. RHBSTW-00678 TaxID=2742661 RepID=UPI0015E98BFF|nr:hypothetical protein [Citrobacter sp. RHBSTW-00678]QLV87811.1 hypothetical protein HV265_12870 [Citrobacter sp. RHBSTW-00678]